MHPRAASQAAPGEVLVSSTVKDLGAGSGIAFQDRGTYELKGVPDGWRLCGGALIARPGRSSAPCRPFHQIVTGSTPSPGLLSRGRLSTTQATFLNTQAREAHSAAARGSRTTTAVSCGRRAA